MLLDDDDDEILSEESAPSRFRLAVILAILVVSLCQLTINPTFLPAAYQFPLPISSVVMLLGFILLYVTGKLVWIPTINRSQALYLAFLAIGLAATQRSDLPAAINEAVHLLLIMVISVWIYQSIAESERAVVGRLLGWLCPVLLVIVALKLNELPILDLSLVKANTMTLIALPFFVSVLGRFKAPIRLVAILVACALAGYTFVHGALILIWMLLLFLALWQLMARPILAPLLGGIVIVLVSIYHPQQDTMSWLAMRSHRIVELTIEEQMETGMEELALPSPRHLEAKAAAIGTRWLPLGGGLGHYGQSLDFLSYYLNEEPDPQAPPIRRDGRNQYLVSTVESSLLSAIALALVLLLAMKHCMTLDDEFDNTGDIGSAPHSVVGISLLGVFLAACYCTVLGPGIGIWVGALLGLSIFSQLRPPWYARLSRLIFPLIYLAGGAYIAYTLNTRELIDHKGTVTTQYARAAIFGDDTYPFGLQEIEMPDPLVNSPRVIRQEAESPSTMPRTALRLPLLDASAQAVMSSAALSPETLQESLAYSVEVPRDGAYRLVVRLRFLEPVPARLQASIGDQSASLVGDSSSGWCDALAMPLLRLKAGTHTLQLLLPREGLLIDYWELRLVGE